MSRPDLWNAFGCFYLESAAAKGKFSSIGLAPGTVSAGSRRTQSLQLGEIEQLGPATLARRRRSRFAVSCKLPSNLAMDGGADLGNPE